MKLKRMLSDPMKKLPTIKLNILAANMSNCLSKLRLL
jgi:hypothetical protein